MSDKSDKTRLSTWLSPCAIANPAITLLETIIALAIITIIFAAVLPQFRVINNSWDSKQGNAEVLQNGRVLMDHINRNLSKAVKITAVSESSVTNGYIQFVANDSNTYRYDDVGANSYVEFGPVGNLSDLAGPVSKLQFTCYDACDLDTPLDPITDANLIRLVKVETTLTNSATLGQDRSFTTQIYLRANANTGGLVGWWKLDETSGLTAADSSRSGHDGTLSNMTGNEWTTGQINGALTFDGTNDYVSVSSLDSKFSSSNTFTVTGWFKTSQSTGKQTIVGQWGQIVSNVVFGWQILVEDNKVVARFGQATSTVEITGTSIVNNGDWHHFALVYPTKNSSAVLYIDGSSQGTGTKDFYTAAPYMKFRIGDGSYFAYNGSNLKGGPFHGTIDDVRIYNRALSAEEIAELANILNYRGFTEAKAGYLTTSLTIPTPSTTAGDLLIAAVATDVDTSASLAAPEGQGWTLINRGSYNGAVTLAAWWKLAGASEPASHQFTWPTWSGYSWPPQSYGWIMRFTGHDPANPINASSAGGQTSSTPTSPAVTTTVTGCLILRLGAFDDDNIVVDSPGLSGHTAITMDESADSNVCVTYQGFADAKVASDGTSITIPKPSGTAQGNFLVAAVAADGAAASMSWTSPTGWSGILPGVPMAPALGIWYKTAGASEPASYTFSWSPSEQAYGWIMRFTGNSPTLVGFQPNWGTSNTPTCSSVTTSYGPFGGYMLILRLGAFDDDAITVGSPGLSGHTAITMDKSNSGSGSCSGGAGYMQVPAGTPSGTANFTLAPGFSKAYATASIPIWSGVYSGTVSGGAGYVKQSAAGDSGTSTFSLASSNEARTLTIAIAPADSSIYDDSIRP
jgi:type II secretory pathway pseudopilin PulG